MFTCSGNSKRSFIKSAPDAWVKLRHKSRNTSGRFRLVAIYCAAMDQCGSLGDSSPCAPSRVCILVEDGSHYRRNQPHTTACPSFLFRHDAIGRLAVKCKDRETARPGHGLDTNVLAHNIRRPPRHLLIDRRIDRMKTN